VTALPTIVKVTADGVSTKRDIKSFKALIIYQKLERLVEADVYDQNKLDAFVE
jgi:hypothetical protein